MGNIFDKIREYLKGVSSAEASSSNANAPAHRMTRIAPNVLNMDSMTFSIYCREQLQKRGFRNIQEASLNALAIMIGGTQYSAVKDGVTYGIVAKCSSAPVSAYDVLAAETTRRGMKAQKALFFTNNVLSPEAIQKAKELNIETWDGSIFTVLNGIII